LPGQTVIRMQSTEQILASTPGSSQMPANSQTPS